MPARGSQEDDHIGELDKCKLQLCRDQDHVHGLLERLLHILLAEWPATGPVCAKMEIEYGLSRFFFIDLNSSVQRVGFPRRVQACISEAVFALVHSGNEVRLPDNSYIITAIIDTKAKCQVLFCGKHEWCNPGSIVSN